MSRKQVKRMIRWESVIIAIIGALLGVVIGVFFGIALQQALANQGVTELVIPVGSLTVYVIIAGAGRRAGRDLARAPRGQAERAGVHLVRVGRRPADIMARMPHLKLVHGSETELPEGEPVGSVLPPGAIAARVDGELRDLSFVPTSDATVEAGATASDARRSPCAAALDRPRDGAGRLRPASRGRSTRSARRSRTASTTTSSSPSRSRPTTSPAIEARMRELIVGATSRSSARRSPGPRRSSASPTSRSRRRSSRARRRRVEARSGAGDSVSSTATTSWADLCLGPHVPSTGRLGAFKLTNVAGAYWRGDEQRPQLHRIYGTAWATDEDLDAYLHRLEEAEKRDHRKLGRQLDLFSSPDELGPGCGSGTRAAGSSASRWRTTSASSIWSAGTTWSCTPHIARSVLWETSGHLAKYADNMYPADADGHAATTT